MRQGSNCRLGRMSLAFITSTNPNGKLFTDIKPILGLVLYQVPGQQAGRQSGLASRTASFPTQCLSPRTGRERRKCDMPSQEALVCLQLILPWLMAQPLHEPLGLTVPENGCLAPGEEEAEHQGALGASLVPSPALHSAAPAPPDPATQSPQW